MSAAPDRRVPVAELRDAVRRAVAESSTHQVADAIGLSQSWVRKFLSGAEPHATTIDRLIDWYAVYRRKRAEAALDALLEEFPRKGRGKVRTSVLDLLREAYRKAGTDPPGWLARE